MRLFDELFPSDRHEGLVQTEWASGWLAGGSGFGAAAEHLTEHRGKFGAEIDQVGLAVFFLQRHRVEMTLKGVLDGVGAQVPKTHDLDHLWECLRKALAPRDASAWADFDARHAEFIQALQAVDASSFTFRYPVDKKGVEVTRPAYIDLTVLNKRSNDFYYEGWGWIDYLNENGLM